MSMSAVARSMPYRFTAMPPATIYRTDSLFKDENNFLKFVIQFTLFFWCRRGESNSHELKARRILSPSEPSLYHSPNYRQFQDYHNIPLTCKF